jgi:hypothetical protein
MRHPKDSTKHTPIVQPSSMDGRTRPQRFAESMEPLSRGPDFRRGREKDKLNSYFPDEGVPPLTPYPAKLNLTCVTVPE